MTVLEEFNRVQHLAESRRRKYLGYFALRGMELTPHGLAVLGFGAGALALPGGVPPGDRDDMALEVTQEFLEALSRAASVAQVSHKRAASVGPLAVVPVPPPVVPPGPPRCSGAPACKAQCVCAGGQGASGGAEPGDGAGSADGGGVADAAAGADAGSNPASVQPSPGAQAGSLDGAGACSGSGEVPPAAMEVGSVVQPSVA